MKKQPTQAPKVIELIRVSGQEQAEEGRAGIPRQIAANRDTVRRHGLEVLRTITAIDVSGRHVQHDPQFQQLFQDLKKPDIAGVVVAEQSRIFRPGDFEDWAILSNFSRNKKLIWTPGGCIDPNTQHGRMQLMMGGMMSGEELHRMRERLDGGKQAIRESGGCPSGNQILPTGVRYVRERNENGKVVKQYWAHEERIAPLLKRAYQMLFEGKSYRAIADAMGLGWDDESVRHWLANPIWIGIRRYAWEKAEEYLPEATAKNPNPKPKYRFRLRAEPLDIPIDLEPLLPVGDWHRAQKIIAGRKTTWLKSRVKDESIPARFLLRGIGRCAACGRLMYPQYGWKRRPEGDRYICSSRILKNTRGDCMAASRAVRRADVDEAVSRLITSCLLNTTLLRKILTETARSLKALTAEQNKVRQQAAKVLKDLDARRARLIDFGLDGTLDKADMRRRLATLDAERRSMEESMPSAAAEPVIDAAPLIDAIARAFAGYQRLNMADRRRLLHEAISEVIIDLTTGTIPKVRVSGGFIHKNMAGSRTASRHIFSFPDLTIRLPQPIEIGRPVQ